MKHKPMVRILIVLWTIMVLSVFTFSVPVNLFFKGKKEKNQYGQIEVTASANQAAVFVEGFNMGTSPLTVENLPPGSYRVIVKASGYNDFITDVKVEEQKVSKVEARMTAGNEDTKVPVCDYSFWDSLSNDEKKRLQQPRYSSLLLGYQNIEVSNFDVKIKSKKSVPSRIIFPFYADMIKEIDKDTHFQQIITDYTDINGMEKVKKVYTSQQAKPGEKTLVLSGVLKKYKKSKKVNVPVQHTQMGNIGITTGGNYNTPHQITVLFRLTDKKNGYIIFNKVISGPISSVSKEFATTLQEALDTLLKREKEKETGH